jgi:hypothetical protein
MPTKNILRVAVVTALLLLIPLISMQFSSDVVWTLSDFVIGGGFIFITGLFLDIVFRKAGKYRAIAVIAVVIGFLYIWAELAVGIFTNWGS